MDLPVNRTRCGRQTAFGAQFVKMHMAFQHTDDAGTSRSRSRTHAFHWLLPQESGDQVFFDVRWRRNDGGNVIAGLPSATATSILPEGRLPWAKPRSPDVEPWPPRRGQRPSRSPGGSADRLRVCSAPTFCCQCIQVVRSSNTRMRTSRRYACQSSDRASPRTAA
jgi:hypothetical protein